MKTPHKKTKPALEIPPAFHKLEKLANGNVKITHMQGIKQSINYQSLDCSFGLSVEVAPEHVHRAGKLLATAVQELLTPKVKQQAEFLTRLSSQNR